MQYSFSIRIGLNPDWTLLTDAPLEAEREAAELAFEVACSLAVYAYPNEEVHLVMKENDSVVFQLFKPKDLTSLE